MNISTKGTNILKKLANDEVDINYRNLLFKSGNSAIDDYDFLRFGILYDLLIDLLSEKISLKEAKIEQSEMVAKMIELRNFISLEEEKTNKDIIEKRKTKTQKRKTISIQKNVLKNALKLFVKRGFIIDLFVKKDILPGDLEKDLYQKKNQNMKKE